MTYQRQILFIFLGLLSFYYIFREYPCRIRMGYELRVATDHDDIAVVVRLGIFNDSL